MVGVDRLHWEREDSGFKPNVGVMASLFNSAESGENAKLNREEKAKRGKGVFSSNETYADSRRIWTNFSKNELSACVY